MRHFDLKHITFAIIAVVVACTALLWSWNTLASLFGAPAAQFKHAVAALLIAAIAKTAIVRRPHETR